MTCEMCVNYGFYEMVTSGKPYGYSGVIPCFTCERYCKLSDKFVLKEGGNKDMKKEIVKYEVSEDGVGLLGFFEDGTFYHIHSDELNTLEKWILGLLKHNKSQTESEDTMKSENLQPTAIENRIKKLNKVTKIQCSKGTYDVNEYMRGMANGLILAEAIIEDKDPEYCEANYPEKDRFLKYPRKGD